MKVINMNIDDFIQLGVLEYSKDRSILRVVLGDKSFLDIPNSIEIVCNSFKGDALCSEFFSRGNFTLIGNRLFKVLPTLDNTVHETIFFTACYNADCSCIIGDAVLLDKGNLIDSELVIQAITKERIVINMYKIRAKLGQDDWKTKHL